MKYLLLVAHGSRKQSSNHEVILLAEKLASMPSIFEGIEPAFLELAEPDIPTAIETCLKQGASEIVVYPYFLAAGKHVAIDMPGQLLRISQQYPDIQFNLTSHLGRADALLPLILDQASVSNDHQSINPELWKDLLPSAQVAEKKPTAQALEAHKTYFWCSCGKSLKQPFCDGSHHGSDFIPLAFSIDEPLKKALCQCKQTQTPPFCDGSHRDL